jgi:uncharacterized membrane protein YbhN (UPF0104 family)
VRRIRTLLSVLLAVAITAGAAWYYRSHPGDFRLITTVSWRAVALLFALHLVVNLFNSFQIKIVTDVFGLNLGFRQWFGLARATALANLILPFPGGASLKAIYLKKFHDFRYGSFIASMMIANLLKLIVFSMFALVLLISWWGTEAGWLIAVPAVFLAGAGGFLLLGHRIPARYLSFSSRLQQLAREWEALRTNRPMIMRLVVLNVLFLTVYSVSVLVSYRAFSVPISLSSCAIVATFSVYTTTLKLMPADLGIKEFVFVAVAALVGTDVNAGLHAAALLRVISTIMIFLLAPMFLPALSELKEDKS